ncbi:MAG: DUF721 domain-containing protein [Gloeocapsa sp. DLM2.Bin57]|nr:MAG: DUF721 domain-containing protein [Gloeocapsa sp. DLM2.Bin57]
MSFKPLPQIIQSLEAQPEWESIRLYRRLVESWGQIVDPLVAQHSRPVSLTRRVLWVATANSVWAQTLTFQRYQILQKLNILLPDTVKDLRFNTVNWVKKQTVVKQEVESTKIEHQLTICPRCHCHTPVAELERWSVCAFCIAREWSKSRE